MLQLAQRLHHLRGAGARLGPPLQAALKDCARAGLSPRVRDGVALPWILRPAARALLHLCRVRKSREDGGAREALIRNDAERPHVERRLDHERLALMVSADGLGCPVGKRALDRPSMACGGQEACQEVGDDIDFYSRHADNHA